MSDESGQSLVETALSMVLATAIFFGLFELSMFAYCYAALYEAAHEGVRYAEVHGAGTGNLLTGCSTTAPPDLLSLIRDSAKSSLHNTSNMVVTVCYPDSEGSRPLSRVQISITYPYAPIVNVLGVHPTLTIYSEGNIVF